MTPGIAPASLPMREGGLPEARWQDHPRRWNMLPDGPRRVPAADALRVADRLSR